MKCEVIADELIGLPIVVETSTDPTKIGISGKVVDETARMLVIETEDGIKKVPKKECTFTFYYEGKFVSVDGRLIVGRPEERIKRGLRLSRKWRIPEIFLK